VKRGWEQISGAQERSVSGAKALSYWAFSWSGKFVQFSHFWEKSLVRSIR